MKRLLLMSLVLFLVVLTGPVYSAQYPNRDIELICPFAAGGVTDLVSRINADFLSREWKVPVNVVNRTGGSGVPAILYLLKSKPDGYTMFTHAVAAGTLNLAISTTIPYKWDDPYLICRTNVSAIVFAVKGDRPWNTLKELSNDIKKDPTKFTFGTGTIGSPSTFSSGLLIKLSGVDDVNKVPAVVFKGGIESATATAGGHVSFCAQNLPEVLGLIRSGHLKALAVTTDSRAKELPNVPTTTEAGFPDIKIMGWNGIMGPKGLPDEVVKRWVDTMKKLCDNEEYKKRMLEVGTIVSFLGPDEFRNFIRKEYEQMRELAEQLGIRK